MEGVERVRLLRSRTWRAVALVVAGVPVVAGLVAVPQPTDAQAAPPAGARMYVANTEQNGRLDIRPGAPIAGTGYDSGDHLAAGQFDAGVEDVLLARVDETDDGSAVVDFLVSGRPDIVMDVGSVDDGFATGDLVGDDSDEIVGAQASGGTVEVRAADGTELGRFDTNFDDDDLIAIGDVAGDSDNDLVVANADDGGRIDVYDIVRHDDGTVGAELLKSFDSSYDDLSFGESRDDMLMVGNVAGDGRDEIIVANANDGDSGNGRIDIYDATGSDVVQPEGSGFDTAFDSEDKIAVGDVVLGGHEELVITNEADSGRADVHELNLPQVTSSSFDTAYDQDDTLAVGDPVVSDIDADGLPDQVELSGIRGGNGEIALDLQNIAGNDPASPCRKDIIVEIDWMKGQKVEGLDAIKEAFASAPIDAVADCPYAEVDTRRGINLVVIESQEVPAQTRISLPADFLSIKAQHFAAALDPYVHYNLWADEVVTADNSDDIAGQVDPGDADGQDLILANGNYKTKQSDGTLVKRTPRVDEKQSTFMHELGHAIGLHHGGAEDAVQAEINCKPNYLSIMNYWFSTGLRAQVTEPDGSVTNKVSFDYSHEDLDDLDEHAESLDETKGVDADEQADVFTRWGNPTSGQGPHTELAGGPLDWDDDGVPGETGVNADLNVDPDDKFACKSAGAAEHMQGFDDWAFLSQRLGTWDDELPPDEATTTQLDALTASWDAALTPDRVVRLAPPRVGFRAAALGIGYDREHLYATHYDELVAAPHASDRPGSLVVLNRSTLAVEARVPVGFKPRAVAVNPVTKRAYVVNGPGGPTAPTLTVVDTATRQVVATVPLGHGIVDVAVNTRINRVYVANTGAQAIQVVDGATNAVLDPIPIGPGPAGLTVDETTNTLYVALNNRSFEPHVSALGVVVDHGGTPQIRPRVDLGPEGTQPAKVAVDAANDRIYVAGLGGGEIRPSLTVLDRSSRAVLARIDLPGPARAVTVNNYAHQIFVASDRGVIVVDDTQLVVDRVIETGIPFSIATEPGPSRQLYAGDVRQGTLTRLSYSSR